MAAQAVFLEDRGSVRRWLVEHLAGCIGRGELVPGERLPPIRAMAGWLGVSRDTVARAYEDLADRGMVEAVVGRGTFVADAGGAEGPAPAWAPRVARLVELHRARATLPVSEGAVALHRLVPDPSLFPTDAFRRALLRALRRSGSSVLSYAPPQGELGLRRVLARRFERAGMAVAEDEVVLCHGASQGISLALRLFAEPGDAIAVEEPTYGNVLATLAALGLEAVPVPMTQEGPDPVELEAALGRPGVKAFYTIPSFHNPLGTSMTIGRRREVLAIAAAAGKPVIEDAYQMDLHHEGQGAPTLFSLDRDGRVVHLYSFSKSLFPGVRVGSIAARGRLVEGLVALKHATHLSDALPLQAGLAEFLREGSYDRHLRRVRRVLRARACALVAALGQVMPRGVRFTRPEGGFQLWLELPEALDSAELLPEAARAGVLFAPGRLFLVDGRPSPGMRLGFAQADLPAIDRGVRALASVIRRRLEQPVPSQTEVLQV